MIALEKFKEIPKLKNFFKESNAYAVFPNVIKGGFGIGGVAEEVKSFKNVRP